MVYAGQTGKRKLTLGVSGRLMKRNLVMWDPETNSLWSQITGTAIHGKLEGKKLSMLPAVFVSLETWKRMYPDTRVLDLSPVRHRAWHYTAKDLAAAKNDTNQALGIGVRNKNETLLVDLKELQKSLLTLGTVGGQRLAFVWVSEFSAPLVYKAPSSKLVWRDGTIIEPGGGRWDPLSGDPVDGSKKPALERFPYMPTTLTAWRRYYPKGKTIRD